MERESRATYRHGERSNWAGSNKELRGGGNYGSGGSLARFRTKVEDDLALTGGTHMSEGER
jgi:hypothetical protein